MCTVYRYTFGLIKCWWKKRGFKNYKMDNHGGDDTKCLKCNLNFTSTKTLKVHQQEKHSQTIINCFKCGLKFSTQDKFRAHWNNRHVTIAKPSVVSCFFHFFKLFELDSNFFLNRVFIINKQATNVALTISDDDSKNSDDAPKESPTVKVKKRKHTLPTTNRCNVCYKAFSSQQSAQVHYRRVHMDWTVECEVCKKSVKKNLYIKLHLNKHRINGEMTTERYVSDY